MENNLNIPRIRKLFNGGIKPFSYGPALFFSLFLSPSVSLFAKKDSKSTIVKSPFAERNSLLILSNQTERLVPCLVL